MLDILQRETNRLHHIIEDVLRLSRLDQGRAQLQFAQVDLHQLILRLVEDRIPLAAEREIDLSVVLYDDDLQIWADEGLISQTFTVLLTNAINYTPPGGSIIVSTSVEEVNGEEWACFSVQDTGPGIPVDEQAHMFDRFFRGQVGRESTIPGTGLGLAIAKEIVDRHQGKIVYTGEENAGSRFQVILPTDISPLPQD
jgi:signal transduction histidine kinase